MIIYQHPQLSPPTACSYLPDKILVYEYFFADCVSAHELEYFLGRGWRKFGHYFFRPACPDCRACTPLRVSVDKFQPSRSQKRVLRVGKDVRVSFGPIHYSAELFDLHQVHSQERFGEEGSFENFAANLHSPPCPALLARYELDGQLVAAGYLDHSAEAFSSVYFVFDPRFSALSLGILGALREIEHARNLDLKYYYLGYMVPGCAKMIYKGRFYPHELYSWTTGSWQGVEKTDRNFQN
jgi:arginine-tRNA-protein transferase